MKAVNKVLDILEYVAKIIAAVTIGVMVIVSLMEITRRYLFGNSSMWADELIRYCIVLVAMIGGAACFRQGDLVAFDLVRNRMRGPAKLIWELVINTISLAFAIFIFRNAINTIMLPSVAKQVSIGLQISMVWPYMPIVIGMGMIVLFAIENYYEIFKKFKDGTYNKKLNIAGEIINDQVNDPAVEAIVEAAEAAVEGGKA